MSSQEELRGGMLRGGWLPKLRFPPGAARVNPPEWKWRGSVNGVRHDGVFLNGNGPQAPQLNRNCSFYQSATGGRLVKNQSLVQLFFFCLFASFSTLPLFPGLSLTIRIIWVNGLRFDWMFWRQQKASPQVLALRRKHWICDLGSHHVPSSRRMRLLLQMCVVYCAAFSLAKPMLTMLEIKTFHASNLKPCNASAQSMLLIKKGDHRQIELSCSTLKFALHRWAPV